MSDASKIAFYKNVIWDWNGTLLNDVWLCIDIVNSILLNHNDTRLNVESYKDIFGFPIVDYYKRLGIDFEKESFDELTIKFMSSYTSNVLKCKLHPGVIDILGGVKKRNIKQFILTAAHREDVINLLGHYSIAHIFEQVQGLDNRRAESKVNKGLSLIKDNSISIDETVLIGDTIHDFEVARALGVSCILIANGHQSKSRLMGKANNCVAVLDNVSGLF